jgi:hypothetical protein
MAIDEIQQAKKRAFLEAFKRCASISKAARLAKVNRATHYDWMQDEDYAKEFESAKPIAAQALEDEAVRRANQGVLKPVYYQGKKVGSIREYSDTLLIFLLKGALPDKYKERVASTLANPDGTPICVRVEYV